MVLRHCHCRHHHLLQLAVYRNRLQLVGKQRVGNGLRRQRMRPQAPRPRRVLRSPARPIQLKKTRGPSSTAFSSYPSILLPLDAGTQCLAIMLRRWSALDHEYLNTGLWEREFCHITCSFGSKMHFCNMGCEDAKSHRVGRSLF